jgi:ubiquitin-like protein Pup
MGVMIDGAYQVEDPGPDTTSGGEFKRAAANIRNWITGDGPFTPDADRYHLYVAWNCPWAHRALLTRAILGLEDEISVSFARPRRTDQGWVYDAEGEYADGALGIRAIHEVYARQRPSYTGRLTVMAADQEQNAQQQVETSKTSAPPKADAAQQKSNVSEKGEKLKKDLDKIIDEIDDVLEENAEEFIRSYVQRGGE